MEYFKVCPCCSEKNLPSEMFCRRCLGDISGVTPSSPSEDTDISLKTVIEKRDILCLFCSEGEILLSGGDIIGRNEKGHELFIRDQNKGSTISRKHARIECSGAQWLLTDLNSSNGTYVNNVRLDPEKPRTLQSGDLISFSTSSFVFTVK